MTDGERLASPTPAAPGTSGQPAARTQQRATPEQWPVDSQTAQPKQRARASRSILQAELPGRSHRFTDSQHRSDLCRRMPERAGTGDSPHPRRRTAPDNHSQRKAGAGEHLDTSGTTPGACGLRRSTARGVHGDQHPPPRGSASEKTPDAQIQGLEKRRSPASGEGGGRITETSQIGTLQNMSIKLGLKSEQNPQILIWKDELLNP